MFIQVDGTIGAGVPMVGVLITHGCGITGVMQDTMVGVDITVHGAGTIGAGEATMVTDGEDGIPLTIMVLDMVMVIMVTDIIIDIMETDTMADMGIMEITP